MPSQYIDRINLPGNKEIELRDSISEMKDVSLSSLSSGHVLTFNGTNWENSSESDPVFMNSAASAIASTDIANWNNKSGIWKVSASYNDDYGWWNLDLDRVYLHNINNAPGSNAAVRYLTIPNGDGRTLTISNPLSHYGSNVTLTLPSSSGTLALTSQVPTESTVSEWGFTKNEGTLTNVTFNGASASVSGTVANITATIPTVNDTLITIQKNGSEVDSFTTNTASRKAINITVPTNAGDVNALPDTTKYASSPSLTIDSSTYVMTLQLKDQDGNNIGASQSVDLPLETMVVGGSYNDSTRKIELTLKNGNTVDFSVADLVSGLQTEITSSNKLSADLISDGTTNKVYTSTEKTKLSGIESGAQVNVKPDWNATSGTVAEILNKPTIPTESTVSGWGFTKNTGTLTGVSFNGTSATVSNGVASISASVLPTVTTSDNNKILQVVNGDWSVVSPVTVYNGSSSPASSLGNDGDIYLQS